jgi:hypothetical protein
LNFSVLIEFRTSFFKEAGDCFFSSKCFGATPSSLKAFSKLRSWFQRVFSQVLEDFLQLFTSGRFLMVLDSFQAVQKF